MITKNDFALSPRLVEHSPEPCLMEIIFHYYSSSGMTITESWVSTYQYMETLQNLTRETKND